MIRTSRQLKALVRNMSKGDSNKALVIIRNYAMERFLERLSLSPYRDNLILKGGILVSAMVGLDNRSTLDIDATIKGLPLSVESAKRIVENIVSIPIDDGMVFSITDADTIMSDADYAGVRIQLNTTLEKMQIPLKIDFSTGDVITPREVAYSFKLMFEDRKLTVLAYNLETILAEKLETLLSRSTANTRMRDFYDLYALEESQSHNIDPTLLRTAFVKTCEQRGTIAIVNDAPMILDEVQNSPVLMSLWKDYQRKFDYATDISWDRVMESVRRFSFVVPST